MQEVLEQFIRVVFPFPRPDTRFYYIYLLVSLLIVLIYRFVLKKRTKLLEWSTWVTKSSREDLTLFLFNGILKVTIFPLIIFSSSEFTSMILHWLHGSFDFQRLEVSQQVFLTVATFITFAVDDFHRFFLHWLMHQNRFLWKFHRTHHTATVLTPLTLYRIHPIESLLASFRNAWSLTLSLVICLFFFQRTISIYEIAGVNLLGFLFNLFGSNLRHSDIEWGWGPLEYLFISPKQHQMHHLGKREYFNSNMGVALSIWDQLFGTFKKSKGVKVTSYGKLED